VRVGGRKKKGRKQRGEFRKGGGGGKGGIDSEKVGSAIHLGGGGRSQRLHSTGEKRKEGGPLGIIGRGD